MTILSSLIVPELSAAVENEGQIQVSLGIHNGGLGLVPVLVLDTNKHGL